MLYGCSIAGPIKANNCPTTPFKIGFPRNPGRGFASLLDRLIYKQFVDNSLLIIASCLACQNTVAESLIAYSL
jgi:hypothetical protein